MRIPKVLLVMGGIAIIIGVFVFIFTQTAQISISEQINIDKAAETGDASLCLGFDDLKLRDFCLVKASLVNPDYSVCSMMSDDELKKTDCYLRSANTTKNPAACDAIEEFVQRQFQKLARLSDEINEDEFTVKSDTAEECRKSIKSQE